MSSLGLPLPLAAWGLLNAALELAAPETDRDPLLAWRFFESASRVVLFGSGRVASMRSREAPETHRTSGAAPVDQQCKAPPMGP